MRRGLAQYRVLRALGQGAQGEVLLAMDTRLHRRVCIKLYHLDSGIAARRRAVAEAWHLTRVEGPRTATIHDVVAAGGRLALVTRYVPGCDLAALIDRAVPLPPANALAIASDIAAALADLRRAGVAHGDLKPANVRIDRDGRAVLVDFGTAALAGEASPGWSAESVSPEQSRGEPAGLHGDFFALGLLLHRMLLGSHPFFRHGRLDRKLLRRGLTETPVLAALPAPAATVAAALLCDLLAADPERRPASTFLLRERLRELRAMLPAPISMTATINALDEQQPTRGPVPRLPARLVRLPLSQRMVSWLRDYWRGGTNGARALLAGSVAASLLLATLVLLQPGPCIAVSSPVVPVGADARIPITDAQGLQDRLTFLLKHVAPQATVLGSGAASDSRIRLSARGTRDVCIARRQLSLEVTCAGGQCLLDLQGRRAELSLHRQLWLPLSVTPARLDAALAQLVAAQRGFLLY